MLRKRGHRQEMLAGLITNVFAAGACIVWLEGVGFSQREGMSRSISDSKETFSKPVSQLPFIPMGRSKQLNLPVSLEKQDLCFWKNKKANDELWFGSASLKIAPHPVESPRGLPLPSIYQDWSPLSGPEKIKAALCEKCHGAKTPYSARNNRHAKEMFLKQLKNSKNRLSQLSQVHSPFSVCSPIS